MSDSEPAEEKRFWCSLPMFGPQGECVGYSQEHPPPAWMVGPAAPTRAYVPESMWESVRRWEAEGARTLFHVGAAGSPGASAQPPAEAKETANLSGSPSRPTLKDSKSPGQSAESVTPASARPRDEQLERAAGSGADAVQEQNSFFRRTLKSVRRRRLFFGR